MDRGSFLISCLLGMGVALAVFFPLDAKRRMRIPTFVWSLFLIVGVVTCIYGLSHSIAPSFATRITAVGKTYDYAEHQHGRDTYHSFRLVPDGSKPVDIETEIIIPGSAFPNIFNGRTFRVVYLDEDSGRALKNEAIDIEILSGKDAGYHDSLDARLFGKWLAIPLGAALGVFGFFGLKYRKGDAMPAASDNDSSRDTRSLLNS